jgi:transcriptional regulator with XRE-family HTH domain
MLRKALGLTQEQLAEAVGVTNVTICKWENDSTVPNATKLLKLSKALKCEVGELLES